MSRKPLITLTPKLLLRSKDAMSLLPDLAKGHFETVITDTTEDLNAAKVKRVAACSGKVYYDLVNARKERGLTDTIAIRVEQFYPSSHELLTAELKEYPNLAGMVRCRDEPRNQDVRLFVRHYILGNMVESQRLGYAGRPASASPVVGYYAKHDEQQEVLIDAVFNKLKGSVLNR